METPPEISNADMARIKEALLDLVEDRGVDADKLHCIFNLLFKRYADGESTPLSTFNVWRKCWTEGGDGPIPEKKETKEKLGSTVRTAMCRARSKINAYFSSPAGRAERFRPEIAKGSYRLVFHLNQPTPDSTSGMKIGRGNVIGILCSLRSNWFNSELISGAEQAARAFPYRVIVAYSDGDLEEEAHQLTALSKQCSAVIVVPTLDEYAREANDLHRPFVRLLKRRYPLVFVDRRVPGCEAPLVGCDNARGGMLAAQYLTEERQCTRILILGEFGSSAARERMEAAEAYLTAKGIQCEVDWADHAGRTGWIRLHQPPAAKPRRTRDPPGSRKRRADRSVLHK